MFQNHIKELLKKTLKAKEIALEIPPDSKLGDFAFACFAFSKEQKKSPVDIAKELAEKIKPDDFIKEVKATGPYVNFFINKAKLAENTLQDISKKKDKYGHSGIGSKEVVVVEYPAPNTNKPLHLGHMRNMALGVSMANILESQGCKVQRVNLNNDRGIHVCKSMLAYQKWGNGKTPEKEKRKPDHFVGDYYVMFCQKAKEDPKLEDEAQEMLRKWEAGDKEVRALWKKMNTWAFKGFKETYKHFGLPKFDKEYFESETYKQGKEIVMQGVEDGIFKEREDGAIVVDLKKQGLGEKVLIRADGTSVYVTQDLYLAQLKHKDFNFDKSIYVVATEQNYHFNVLFTLLKKLKYSWADGCYHFAYGMVLLPEGKMKSREGTVVDADDLMLEMEDLAREEITKRHKDLEEETVHERGTIVGLGAIKFYLLKIDAIKDMTFLPEESISFEGDTGPYLQYTHARACSVLRKAKEKKMMPDVNIKYSLLCAPSEIALMQLLSEFPDKVADACVSLRPHIIAQYLLALGRAFNEFYHACHCLKEEDEELAKARLLLIDSSRQVIKNGLNLLGIHAPEEM
ncbi:arginine--tRNA ligase [Candidatus Woesearchaeota archaeon]|nr:arginine--tRNA ligase [Candidatus Woesearchaeota archaeon]MBW3005376.1 arginine--tRNA ligase [Candidatus Woesearchaeota archaeon]